MMVESAVVQGRLMFVDDTTRDWQVSVAEGIVGIKMEVLEIHVAVVFAVVLLIVFELFDLVIVLAFEVIDVLLQVVTVLALS